MIVLAIGLALIALAVSGYIALVQTAAPYRQLPAATAADLGVWCPATRQIQRIRVGTGAVSRGLTVVACDRFPSTAVRCDHGCLLALRGATLTEHSFDVRHALVFPSTN